MKKLMLMCLMGMFLIGLFGCMESQVVQMRNIDFSNSHDEIKVMTFNTRVASPIDLGNNWPFREKAAYTILESQAADIFGLQEVKNNQVEKVVRILPQYSYYTAGRKDGKKKGEMCPIFYRKDRFKQLNCGTFWFSKNPIKPNSKYGGTIFPRISSWVYLEDMWNGKKFYVYNLHLDPFNGNARKKSVKLLTKQIALRKTRDPFIIMGDFNATLNSSAFDSLLKPVGELGLKFVDTWQAVNSDKKEIGTRHLFTGKTNWGKIDHIFVSGGTAIDCNVITGKIEGKWPSDHFPVISRVKLN
jgi:endonuclease/exonuclease/phosphatase family metal-dependent hydrolase